MGRLTKKKADQIANLRKQAYTQKEVAEKLGVHVRTVRKYDPIRPIKEPGSRDDISEPIRNALSTTLEWIDILSFLLIKIGVNVCPKCLGDSLEYDSYEEAFICRRCRYRPVQPEYICRTCFSYNSFEFDKESKT